MTESSDNDAHVIEHLKESLKEVDLLKLVKAWNMNVELVNIVKEFQQ